MELFSTRYGRATGSVGAIVAFIALVPYTSVQVIGLALIFKTYGIGFEAGLIVATTIICLWALLGGLRGVALTDALQGIFMLIVALVAVIWCGNTFGGIELSTFPNKVWTPIFFINITLPWCFFAITNPQVLQRVFIIKEKAGLRKMLVLFGVFGLVYTVIVTLIGFSAKFGTLTGLFPQIADRDTVIVNIISKMAQALGLVVSLSIIFAAVSTANSIILTLSSMLTRDVMGQRSKVWYGRLLIIVLTAVVLVFSLTRPAYLVELAVSSSRILLVFLPLFVGVFHFKWGGRFAGLFTLVGGLGGAVVFSALRLSLSSVYTLVAAFVLFLIGAAVDTAIPSKVAQRGA
jgi:SSS family solute:Na+ symporter